MDMWGKMKSVAVWVMLWLLFIFLGGCAELNAKDNALSDETANIACGPLPVKADGTPFDTLDSYLKFRQQGGQVDKPFYERLDDGRYKLNRGRAESRLEPVFFTREELLRKYGFAC